MNLRQQTRYYISYTTNNKPLIANQFICLMHPPPVAPATPCNIFCVPNVPTFVTTRSQNNTIYWTNGTK